MPVETPSLFAQVIRDHLELKERNSDLQMPIDRYKSADPFDNHPLFKTEEQARLEETMDGVELEPWPGEAEIAEPVAQAAPAAEIEDSGFWAVDRARDFDWGD
jgi:hypothetical protein